tara:strand:+ start:558 stop:770 length:213 start_codon:yes stop_codon:yes gene_type:complete
MLKTSQEKGLKDIVNHILNLFHLERNIVGKVGSIILIIMFTSCSKDINIDPVQTIGNNIIKTIMKGNNGN